jgi:hypothetical protein
MPRYRKPSPPVPKLWEVNREPHWLWLHCAAFPKCTHMAAVAIAPLVIRWGKDASSDMLRRCARCTRCGDRGATLMHPSWGGSNRGWQEFPLSLKSESLLLQNSFHVLGNGIPHADVSFRVRL